MSRFVLSAAVAVMLVQFDPGRASADIILYESLDLVVASADLVVRGKVIEIVSKKGDDEGVVWNRVTVKVAETIKGEKLKEVSFLVHETPFEAQGTAWRNLRGDMLFCLNTLKPAKGPFRVDYILRSGWNTWAIPLTGTPGTKLPIYSIDFKSLTAPKDILAAARAAAEPPPGKAKSKLEWIVQGPETPFLPHAVLYPDSDCVRNAARNRKVDLRLWKE